MRLRITASRPAIVRFSPDQLLLPRSRSCGPQDADSGAGCFQNLRNRCSVAHALFRLVGWLRVHPGVFETASGDTLITIVCR